MGYYSETYIGELMTKFSPEQLERMYQELESAVKRGDEKAIYETEVLEPTNDSK